MLKPDIAQSSEMNMLLIIVSIGKSVTKHYMSTLQIFQIVVRWT